MEKKRRGITEADVWSAADALLLEGRRPTIEGVRQRIGRGSPNTVMTYLDTWFGRLGRRLQAPEGTEGEVGTVPSPVADAATHLWHVALEAARAQMQQEFDADRDHLHRETEAMNAERQRVAELERTLKHAERGRSEHLEMAKAQLLERTKQVERLEDRGRHLQDLNQRLDEELRGTQAALASEQAAAEASRQAAADRTQELERAKERERRWVGERDQINQELRGVREQLEQSQKGLARERADATRVRDSALAREKDLEAQLSNARQAHGMLQSELDAARAQMLGLRAKVEEREDELAGLQARLTEALRAVGRTSGLTLVVSNRRAAG